MDDLSDIFVVWTFVNSYRVENSIPTYFLSISIMEVFIVVLELEGEFVKGIWGEGAGQ